MIGDFGTVIIHAGNEISEASTSSQTSDREQGALSHVESTSFVGKGSELTDLRCFLLLLSFPLIIESCNSSLLFL